MSKVMRSVKNVTKGYSAVQVKVRNATSNDPWGPTGTEMSEIAQITFNSSNEFYEVMDMLDKRLNDKGKNWRHVLKALKLLDYCLHEGSELVVTWTHKNLYIIKTLREFQYIDDDGRDVGQNVRVSAKELTSLVLDEERLRAERSDRKTWKSRVSGLDDYGQSSEQNYTRPERRNARPHRAQRDDEEDAEYQLAIEASKAQEEEDKRRRQGRPAPDDDDLAKAIKLSQDEEDMRRRELEERNATSLFDDDPIQVAQPTGFNQGYQQQSAVDWSGNPIDQSMQSQPTSYPSNMYANQTGFQPQPTGFQTSYMNGQFGAQPTGYDPYGQQQAQQNFQPQQTGYNPYAQQAVNPYQTQAQPQPQVAEAYSPAGTNNPWATNHQQQALKPTPTGSNNPFAQAAARPVNPPVQSMPTLQTLAEQKSLSQFNNTPFNTSQSPQQQTPQDEHSARLNALLATGEGMDTFGNTGNLRIPAQHTAPGTFVNSAGSGLGRIHENQTGSNPFLSSQFTGMPQTTYGASPFGGGVGHQMPAATGPAGFSNGFGSGIPPVPAIPSQHSNNPFGAPHQQQGQRAPGEGELIQF